MTASAGAIITITIISVIADAVITMKIRMRSAALAAITAMTVMTNAAADAITTITTTSAGASTMSTTRGVVGITVK